MYVIIGGRLLKLQRKCLGHLRFRLKWPNWPALVDNFPHSLWRGLQLNTDAIQLSSTLNVVNARVGLTQ